jgi:hypothetical protein
MEGTKEGSSCGSFIRTLRAIDRLLGNQGDDGVYGGIDAIDLAQMGFDHFARR